MGAELGEIVAARPCFVLDTETRRHFAEEFPQHHFTLRHNLVGNPLLTLERLAELAKRLPRHCIESNRGDLAVSQDPGLVAPNRHPAAETIARISEAGSWVALKYVELDPEFRRLLAGCISEISHLCSPRTPGLHQLEGYIFISSPGAITPYHFDDEHNFLLQVSGSKTVHTWEATDPEVLSHLDLERYYSGAHRNLVFKDKLDGKRRSFRLSPGDGLHIPVHSPHWVENGGSPSVSFSATFRSQALRKEASVHWLNAKLRARGLSPRPCGFSRLGDEVKFHASRLIRKLA